MANIYHTNEVEKLMNDKLDKMALDLVNDNDLKGGEAIVAIQHIRLFRQFVNEIVEDMEKIDKKYDEEIAAYRARMAEKESADDNG